MNDFPESEKKMHIESWMIDETRINHFKNTYLSASRNYEAGRERMVGYVVKILDNRKDAVLCDIQSMIELIESLIQERNNLINKIAKEYNVEETAKEYTEDE